MVESRTLAVVASIVLIVPAVSGVPGGPVHPDQGPDRCDGRVPHPPIRVTENRGPQGFIVGREPVTGQPIYRPGSGVVAGNGTAEDSYVIAGWCITPQGAEAAENRTSGRLESAGILVQGTSAHVVIRDNVVDGRAVHTPIPDDRQKAGVQLEDANHVSIAHNTIESNDFAGVLAHESSKLRLGHNTIRNNDFGVAFSHSRGFVLRDNALGAGGLGISGSRLMHYQHTIPASNTVNGQPLRYVRGQTGVQVAEPAGQVILVNTTRAHVTGLDLTDTGVGLTLASPGTPPPPTTRSRTTRTASSLSGRAGSGSLTPRSRTTTTALSSSHRAGPASPKTRSRTTTSTGSTSATRAPSRSPTTTSRPTAIPGSRCGEAATP